MLNKYLRKIVGFFFGRQGFQNFFEKLFFISLKGMNIGGGALVSQSGEAWVLKKLSAKLWESRDRVNIFDVGANKGEYALMAQRIFNSQDLKYKIYCFEPSESAYQDLKTHLEKNAGIILHNFGLGSEVKEVTLFSNEQGSGLASVYYRDLSEFNMEFKAQETIKLTTLDIFCEQNQIQKIDFLKLDAEGSEFEILKGAKATLEKGVIEVIQFEFGGANIDARVFLRDFINLLKSDFVIYRVLKNGLKEFKYTEFLEIFITTNFLAVKKNLGSIV